MTNKEAIEHLKNINSRYPCSLDSTFRDECEMIAINLAIKALRRVDCTYVKDECFAACGESGTCEAEEEGAEE